MTPVSLTLTHRWVGAHVIICHDRCLTWPWHHSKCNLSQKIQDWKSSSKSAVCSGNVSSQGHCIFRAFCIQPAYWFCMVLHNQRVSWSLQVLFSRWGHCTFVSVSAVLFLLRDFAWYFVIEKNCYMTNSLLPEAETAVPVKSTEVLVSVAFAAGIVHCNRNKLLYDKFSSSWSRDCSSSASQHEWLFPLPLLQVWYIVIEKHTLYDKFSSSWSRDCSSSASQHKWLFPLPLLQDLHEPQVHRLVLVWPTELWICHRLHGRHVSDFWQVGLFTELLNQGDIWSWKACWHIYIGSTV